MPPFISLTGQRFGRLTVIDRAPNPPNLQGRVKSRWRCRCDCGCVVDVEARNMSTGRTRSCGCLMRETNGVRARVHGGVGSLEYQAWMSAKTRCFDPNNAHFDRYGGRGIAMCKEWRHDFAAFLAHVGPKPTPQHSLDRWPNNDGNYEVGNVRWATRKEQALTRSTTIRFRTIDDDVVSLKDVARILAINQIVLKRRFIRSGVLHTKAAAAF